MSDLLVVMAATEERGFMKQYREQLESAGIESHVERIEDFQAADSLGYEISYIRHVLRKFPKVETFIFTDAFDVLFYGTKEEVLAKIPNFTVLLGAERNCYPDETLARGIYGVTPWKFANGGLLAGHRESIEAWMRCVEGSAYYRPQICNQTFFNTCLFHEVKAKFEIDSATKLFYCLHKEAGELDFDRGIPVNTLCGTHPNFIHANGKWPFAPMLDLCDKSLGIVKDEPKLVDIIFNVPMSVSVCEACRDRLLKAMLPKCDPAPSVTA